MLLNCGVGEDSWESLGLHGFIELDKAVVLVWLDWLVFCDYGFSVSALWCPLAIPTILLGFLLPWTWGISSRLLQQSAATAPYLGRGVSPHRPLSWPWTWNSSFRPSSAHAAITPWTGVAPPGLQIAVKRRKVKSKGEKERYKHLNAEFQRITRRDKESLLQRLMQRNRGKQQNGND